MQTLLSHRQPSKKIRPASGCRRSSENKATQRTSGFGRHGFLNYHFAPVAEDKEGFFKKRKLIEQDFFTSVANFCSLYNIEIPLSTKYPFPLNIVMAYEELKHQLSSINPNLELIVLEENNRKGYLATVQTFNIGNTLYYIPIRPLSNLLQNADCQQEAELLLFVFAYLYHVVDIPWFMNCGSFLEDTYNCIESWLMDEPEPGEEEEILEKLATFQQMNKEGIILERRLQEKKKLQGWQSNIKRFLPKDEFGISLKRIAQFAYELHKNYPNTSILHSVIPDLLFPEYEERLHIDHYLSFFWDDNDALYDSLIDYINVSLQEYGLTDEPVSLQRFSQPQSRITHCLDFETRLFTLIDDLCTVLNQIT